MRKNFCSLPFIHTAIEANGDIKGCCLTPAFAHADGSPYNLNYDGFDESVNSPEYLEFVESFKRDERHPACQECWAFDDDQTVSNRIKFTRSTEMYTRGLSPQDPQRNLKFLEVKIGNSCNLKCRICGPHNSSKAASEAAEITGSVEPLKHTLQSQWIHRPEVWQQISAVDWETIHLMGGEPFLDKTHIPMLEAFVNEGRASKIGLWYNTNGTVFPEHLIPLLQKFKWVHISLSVDDLGSRFEYQRFPAKWPLVVRNLERFFALDKKTFKVHVDICWSLMNVFYFDEIMSFYREFFAQHGLRFKDLSEGRHFVTGQDLIFCPKSMRPEQKQLYLAKLRSSPFWQEPGFSDLLQDLVQHIQVGTFKPEVERQRIERITSIDTYRKQSFAAVFPELESLVQSPMVQYATADCL